MAGLVTWPSSFRTAMDQLRTSETRSDSEFGFRPVIPLSFCKFVFCLSVSDESHEETLKGKILRSGKREKKEKYEHLGYVSSEEEFLVTDGGK